jgi:hypothetical protein
MQATLQLQAAAPAPTCRRTQQIRCNASASMVPPQQRAMGVNAPKVGALTSQRNVAAHAKGAIKPMEATFTEFKLVGKDYKVRGGREWPHGQRGSGRCLPLSRPTPPLLCPGHGQRLALFSNSCMVGWNGS